MQWQLSTNMGTELQLAGQCSQLIQPVLSLQVVHVLAFSAVPSCKPYCCRWLILVKPTAKPVVMSQISARCCTCSYTPEPLGQRELCARCGVLHHHPSHDWSSHTTVHCWTLMCASCCPGHLLQCASNEMSRHSWPRQLWHQSLLGRC